jgi:hypothetical protein
MRRLFALVPLMSMMIWPTGAVADWVDPPAPAAEGSAAPAAPQIATPPPRASLPQLHRQGGEFIDAYWDIVSDNTRHVLDYLRSNYAPVVNYYGKPMRREAILAEKQRYLERWPDRKSWAAATGPQIACDEATSECVIRGVRDFENASAERADRAAGRFAYTYKVRFAAGSAQILSEDSNVTARR